MSEKIRVLMVPSDGQGVGHFRNIWPAQAIQKYHSDEFYVEINNSPNLENIEYFKNFDIIHFHRHLGPKEKEDENFHKLKELGVTLVMDVDDYWEPFYAHPLYQIIKQEKLAEKIEDTLPKADYVTTTTSIFADEIKKFNKNVQVIPNAVDPKGKMWRHKDTRLEGDERCRIAWIGGSSHFDDLLLMQTSMHRLYNNKDLSDKFQMILCGFDTRGTITEIDQFGRQKVRPIEPHETVWNKFESIFAGGQLPKAPRPGEMPPPRLTVEQSHTGLMDDPEYAKWLYKIEKKEPFNVLEKKYMRRWTLPLTQYAKHYDYCDVCLAPLNHIDTVRTDKGQIINKENVFNKVKSELKIIESGMKKKTLIAQDFGIYSELIEDGVNGILIPTDKNDKKWFQAMRDVITNKDYREELANNLHEFVVDKYDIKNVTANRVEFYKQIVKEKKAVTV